MGNSNSSSSKREYQIQRRDVFEECMRRDAERRAEEEELEALRIIRAEFINNTLVNAIKEGVNILIDDDDDDDDDLEGIIFELLKNLKEDLLRLGYRNDPGLQELLTNVSRSILMISQSDDKNLENFLDNFNNMNQLLDYLP